MTYDQWKDKISGFKTVDVRGVAGNFFPGLKKQAEALPAGQGLEIIQTFDPVPLYPVMESLGYVHHTEQLGDHEFHAWFYRLEEQGFVEISSQEVADGRARSYYAITPAGRAYLKKTWQEYVDISDTFKMLMNMDGVDDRMESLPED